MIKVTQKGDWKRTTKFLQITGQHDRIRAILDRYGQLGVENLMLATPIDTGRTASSWNYEVTQDRDGKWSIVWSNSNVNNHVNIAIILQYGHGTRNGGYVSGIDYINPALKPVFDDILDKIWEEVTIE